MHQGTTERCPGDITERLRRGGILDPTDDDDDDGDGPIKANCKQNTTIT
jgi:hypothetical protein